MNRFLFYFSVCSFYPLACNEPNDQLNASLWNQYLADVLTIVRETNPTRDVVIGPASWNVYDWLSTLDVPNDEHLIVTFHYYLPFQFTHQGAEWEGDEAQGWLGATWDATDSEKAEVRVHFDSVAEWAQRHDNVGILLGELGAQKGIRRLVPVGQPLCAAKRNVTASPGRTESLPRALGFILRRRRYGTKTY